MESKKKLKVEKNLISLGVSIRFCLKTGQTLHSIQNQTHDSTILLNGASLITENVHIPWYIPHVGSISDRNVRQLMKVMSIFETIDESDVD